eukprot:CAMPEP_0117496278 /NCGR_PEP_ID=MMETSP0784-20121206/20571_1 /TAXON_ID=39447 /ORGANISM="" /LENGTH=556 /DNA_ID=CAMNT_0005291237 /DNA_START=115 /DNA_END=1783 /DNA_ORIENTATION=+
MVYAVRGGPRPGLYETWAEAERNTKGQPGALCKKFKDHAQAESFVRGARNAAAPPAQPPGDADAKARGVVDDTRKRPRQPEDSPQQPVVHAGRTYLEVPFAQKDEAKQLGARWDPERKKWFAESMSLSTGLLRWLPGDPSYEGAGKPSTARLSKANSKVPSVFLPADERKALEVAQPDELAIYTDGACKGNRNVTSTVCPAGWGFCVVGGGGADGRHSDGTAKLVAELYGPVVLDSSSKFFLGAEVGSNNTGEVSAICEALLWLRDFERSQRSVAICYDSTYAAKTTTGEFKAEKNKDLVERARKLLREVRATRRVRFEHVKGHSGHRWNEAADRLANRGAAGERCTTGRWFRGSTSVAAPPSATAAVAWTSRPGCKEDGADPSDRIGGGGAVGQLGKAAPVPLVAASTAPAGRGCEADGGGELCRAAPAPIQASSASCSPGCEPSAGGAAAKPSQAGDVPRKLTRLRKLGGAVEVSAASCDLGRGTDEGAAGKLGAVDATPLVDVAAVPLRPSCGGAGSHVPCGSSGEPPAKRARSEENPSDQMQGRMCSIALPR